MCTVADDIVQGTFIAGAAWWRDVPAQPCLAIWDFRLMFAKALIGLASLTIVTVALPALSHAQDWPTFRAAQASAPQFDDVAPYGNPTSNLIRRTFRSFSRPATPVGPRTAQQTMPVNDVCRLPTGISCIVTPPLAVGSGCACGETQGVIESRE
jgi:hypothetical protein